MRTLKLAACALLCVGLAACEQQIKDTHPDQVVTKRRAIFKQLNRAMEPIGLVANGRKEATPQELQVLVRDLEQLSTKPWVYFTPDGSYPPSRATALVWNDPEAFKKAQDQYQGTVQALTAAASGGSKEAVQTAVNDVVASCKACHKQFRLD
jgi:cytochrome c556